MEPWSSPTPKSFRPESHALHALIAGTREPPESLLDCLTCRMLRMQAVDLLLQYLQVIRGIEMVNDLLKKSTEPFSVPITRYFSGGRNENLAKFTPY
jgi:hypothetical protein